MPNTLIAFGCSFTYGDELLDPNIKPGEPCNSRHNDSYRNSHCYAGIVAEHYGLDFVNTAFPGASLESMRYTLYWVMNNLDVNNCIFIVGMTNAGRNSYYNARSENQDWNRHIHGTWLDNKNNDFATMHKLWLANSNDQHWIQFNSAQTVGYFDSTGVPTVFLPVWSYDPFINGKYVADFVLEPCLQPDQFAPMGHPNESGHKMIAQRLISYIDRVKLF